MAFQTDDTILSNHCIVDGAFRQIQTVAGEQGQVAFEFGQAKGDRSAHYVDDLVVAMRVRGINIMRAV